LNASIVVVTHSINLEKIKIVNDHNVSKIRKFQENLERYYRFRV